MTRRPDATIARLFLVVAALGVAAPVAATTLQQLPIQGWVTDAAGVAASTANLAVRIYAAAAGGEPLYDSGPEFAGAVVDGRLDIVVGAAAPLLLDDTAEYWLELQVGADEMIGDAASGRWRFRPGGGSHARPDLESRLAALEAALGVKAGARSGAGGAVVALRSAPRTVHGLPGLGRVAGTAASGAVTANLLPQPVGPFASASYRVLLGPHYLLMRDVLASPVPLAVPSQFALYPCRPNPFNPRTTVRYDLPTAAIVDLVVYDLSGRRLRTLRRGAFELAGTHEAPWDGRDDGGHALGSGVYLCRLSAGGFRATRTLTLVK